MSYAEIYTISKGLNVVVTSLMDQRSVYLGGTHLHKLFCIPVRMNTVLYRMEEISIEIFLRNPTSLKILKQMHILFVDEIGKISSEML